MSGNLLQTKLFVPPLRPNVVTRPRLIERLNQGIRLGCKLTLISAPAGFGKTTLVVEWLNQLTTEKSRLSMADCSWLSLDEHDNDPARFFHYLVAALQRNGVEVSQPIQKLLEAPKLPPLEALLTRLINDIAATSNPFLVVLDDYHTITEIAIHQGIEFLLEQQPPQMHLVIATRHDPSLALPRLRGRGQVTELRQSDLRFTADEAAAFLNRSIGLNLAASEITALEERTEGWIVGLQLAAVSMRRLKHRADVSSFVHAFTGSNRHVLDYLVEEVLRQQPESVQAFLQQTAILDRLSGPLCAAVTGQEESQAILEQIERENLFVVPLDDVRIWYRYHHLFAELLRARLRETRPGQLDDLHRRAASWHERHGFSAEAIRHALASQDMTLAADVIERAANRLSTWSSTDIAQFLTWMNALPDNVVAGRPWLRLFASRAHYVTGHWETAKRLLKELEDWLHAQPNIADYEQILSTVVADWASYAAVRGDVQQAIEYARRALARVPDDRAVSRGRPLAILGLAHARAGAVTEAYQAYSDAIDVLLTSSSELGHAVTPLMCNLADLQMLQGRLRQAKQTCHEAMQIGTIEGVPIPSTGFADLQLAKILYEWNDLDAAEQHLMEGLERLNKGGITDQFGNVQAVLAQIKQAQGDVEAATQAIQQAVDALQDGNIPRLTMQASAYQARIWLAQGELHLAQNWADQYRQIGETEYSREFEELTLARVLMAGNQSAEAKALLTALLTPAEVESRMGRVIEILALRASASRALGRMDEAMAGIARALTLAEPEGYVRLFVDEGAPMAQLLHQAARAGPSPTYVSLLLAAFEAEATSATGDAGTRPAGASADSAKKPSILIEPLTDRELDVLQHLAQGLSNREIAAKLFVSPNTVRTHTYNLYGKLGVHSRIRAVSRARELGLLSSS